MRHRYIAVILIAIAFSATGSARQLRDRSEQERALIALDKTWGEANIAGDEKFLQDILADDLVASGPAGIVDKAIAIRQSMGVSRARRGASRTTDNYVIRWLGPDTAVMTHKSVLTYRQGPNAATEEHYSLHVWVKRDGRWKVVATQLAPVEGSACK